MVRLTTTATVCDHHLRVFLLLLDGGVDFHHLDAGAGISEGGKSTVLQDLSLQLELATQAVEERGRQITVVDGASDRGPVVGEAL
jgi:hypothetical protein